jgi:hypothetical protein
MTPILTTPQASVRGNTLFLTLPDAVNPVVWQMDIGQARSAALEVVPANTNWQIRLKTMAGATQDVALYDTRDRAVRVLTLVHQTLTADRSHTSATTPARTRHWMLAATALALFVILVGILWRLVPPPGYQADNVTAPASASSAVGIPQSADDVLNRRGGTP